MYFTSCRAIGNSAGVTIGHRLRDVVQLQPSNPVVVFPDGTDLIVRPLTANQKEYLQRYNRGKEAMKPVVDQLHEPPESNSFVPEYTVDSSPMSTNPPSRDLPDQTLPDRTILRTIHDDVMQWIQEERGLRSPDTLRSILQDVHGFHNETNEKTVQTMGAVLTIRLVRDRPFHYGNVEVAPVVLHSFLRVNQYTIDCHSTDWTNMIHSIMAHHWGKSKLVDWIHQNGQFYSGNDQE